MGFVKVVKNKAYFKRYQVQFRRRREGKTDYQARKRLITQDKNKYNAPKYRLVVRFTNTDIITQIVFARIAGDVVVTAAQARELPKYGLNLGLTNYAAAYATGLLLARRHLKKLGLDTKYVGKEDIDGEDYNVEPVKDGPRPFKAHLDIGLVRTTTGHRVFSALKGAVDGGLNVPHSESRFFGYNREEKKLDAALLRKAIFGGHVADYMRKLADEDPSKYQRQFSRYIKAGISPEKVEALYQNVHKAIRANPVRPTAGRKTKEEYRKAAEPYRTKALTLEQRRERVAEKKAQLQNAATAAADDEEAEE
jgi:large subunit ribosomal protein L5e